MSKIYSLTQKIHSLIPQINQKYGLEIKIKSESNYYYDTIAKGNPITHQIEIVYLRCISLDRIQLGRKRFISQIQASQIRQILVVLERILAKPYIECDHRIIYEGKIITADLLCQKWLDGINPLTELEPETVLQELVEVLENLLK